MFSSKTCSHGWQNKKGFSLIELLVVIVLIAIISIIAFVNFGNQSSKARNAIRYDSSSKIQTAFQVQYTQDKIPSTSCLPGSSEYSLSGTLSGTGCNVILDGSSLASSFLNGLGITGQFKDPSVSNSSSYPNYEFNYKLGGSNQEFVYQTEDEGTTAMVLNKEVNAFEYESGSLNKLHIDGNTPDTETKSISPVIIKDKQGNLLNATNIQTGVVNGVTKVIKFDRDSGYNTLLSNSDFVVYNEHKKSPAITTNPVIPNTTPSSGTVDYCLTNFTPSFPDTTYQLVGA